MQSYDDVLYDFLDDFIVVYLDDMVINSKTFDDHLMHLKMVLQRFQDHRLYVKMEKYEFTVQEVKFLGHLVDHHEVRMDPKKVEAIVTWQPPIKVTELRSFLGLANYYRKFITGYSKRASPLIDLLKKDAKWVWSDVCQEAFEKLKAAIASEPILRLPNFELPF